MECHVRVQRCRCSNGKFETWSALPPELVLTLYISPHFKIQEEISIGSMVPYLANGKPFELLGIPYLVGKIKFKLFFQGPLAK